MTRAPRRPLRAGAVLALFAALALVPLGLLTFFSIRASSNAVREEVRAHVSGTAAGRADAVTTELSGLVDLVESFARRPSMIAAARSGDRAGIAFQLGELRTARGGIAVAFLAEPDGTLVDIAPRTPEIVGRNFSFRDWYRGVNERDGSYVSEAYVTQARGRQRVVAAATFVRSGSGDHVAILAAAYGLGHIQSFVEHFAATEGVRVTVTDQRGVVLATPEGLPSELFSIRDDPRVSAALAGRSGVLDRSGPRRDELSAYAPVRGLGWTVTASIPRDEAFSRVSALSYNVIAIAIALAVVLVAGLAFLARTLWQRTEAERQTEDARRRLADQKEALEAARDELELQNLELARQTAELEEHQARLSAANEELAAQQNELERTVDELAHEKERVERLLRFGEALAAETELEPLSELVLRHVCDFAGAEVGALYVADDEPGSRPTLAAVRGLDRERLPERVAPGRGGLPERALAERRPVSGSYGEGALRVTAYGEELSVRHDAHLPLVQGDRPIGVLTVARLGDTPFSPDELEGLQGLSDEAAVALANALSFRTASRLASINRAVIDATPDGIRLVDLEGRRQLENKAMAQLSHDGRADPDESMYARVREIAARTREPERFVEAMEAVRADPEREAELDVHFTDTGQWLYIYTAPVRDESGVATARIFVVRDVTAQRDAERLKSELLSTVSHELRTPLASILGFSELMTTRRFDDETRDRFLRTIHKEAQRLTDLINDFLDLQRIEQGRFTLDLRPFDLRELLADQVALFAGQSEAHDLQLDAAEEPLEVLGERDRVAQVVANLVSNAIKYSPGGGRVEVSAQRPDGYVRVDVRDEGLGIPTEQQAGIFKKFFRVDSSDTREIGGTGLGLALAREIVEAHGGRIGFEAVEGEGSTFWFELPSGPRSRAQRALVIEDDPDAAMLLRTYLEEEGLAVEVVASGEDGLLRARAAPPALVCLDITLDGELDGWQVLSQLKEDPVTANVPVVVCTAGEGREWAAVLGAANFVTKPFAADQLRTAVRRVLGSRGGSLLVVDDEEPVRRLVIEALRGDFHEFREAADGEEALAEIRSRRPDAVVLDLAMPKLDGLEVLERLADEPETRSLPVIVLTARKLTAGERRLLSERVVSLLAKSSFSAQDLRRVVTQALGRNVANGPRNGSLV